jgi:hypothetical protein
MPLTNDSIVLVSKDQMAAEVAGETVILGLTSGRYYGLDPVGARIWQLLQSPLTVAEVCRAIVAEYDVEPDRCQADLLMLLQKLLDAGLVEVRTAGAS